MVFTDAEGRPQMGQISRPVPRDPTGHLAPGSSAQLPRPGVQASTSSAGYAEVYEHRQPRLPVGMRGNDTASGSMRKTTSDARCPIGSDNKSTTHEPNVFWKYNTAKKR